MGEFKEFSPTQLRVGLDQFTMLARDVVLLRRRPQMMSLLGCNKPCYERTEVHDYCSVCAAVCSRT